MRTSQIIPVKKRAKAALLFDAVGGGAQADHEAVNLRKRACATLPGTRDAPMGRAAPRRERRTGARSSTNVSRTFATDFATGTR
jgi:hypothetical protein